jgi:AraC-like DNA-binding protein
MAKMRDSLVSIWSTDDLSHAEFSRARHHSFAFEPHFHSTVCLALIVSGALKLTIGRQTETAAKGSFVFINAGDVHAGHATSAAQGWVMRTLHVAPVNLAEQMRNHGLRAEADLPIRSGIHNERALADLFFGIHACAQTDDDRLKRDESLQRLVSVLAGHAEPAHRGETGVPTGSRTEAKRIRDYIEDRLFEQIRLSDLSKLVSMPPYTVVRVFRRTFGIPPHRYHTQRRVDAAQKLIRDRVPLSSISHLCGFADQAHLTRAFRRTLGYTPGLYARSIR